MFQYDRFVIGNPGRHTQQQFPVFYNTNSSFIMRHSGAALVSASALLPFIESLQLPRVLMRSLQALRRLWHPDNPGM